MNLFAKPKTKLWIEVEGPGGRRCKAHFPFGQRHLEFVGGVVGHHAPVVVCYSSPRAREPRMVLDLIVRLWVNGYSNLSLERRES